ncbi:MAG: ATP-grasp domain-containing protein, partial [Verrucomicrobia bacterium]|nr:ATP-grasp domain-containing protein [Verrucomicrobiota bacterium]
VQRALDAIGVPYTGSGPEACRLTFDKADCQARLSSSGVPIAPSVLLSPGQRPELPLPLVIKPCRQGSSIGISCVRVEDEMVAALEAAFRFDERVLAEVYIPGRELTVGIVAGVALPIVEIKAPETWYSYDAKYAGKTTEYLVPAPLPEALGQRCADLAVLAYQACDCRGMARIDFRLRPDGAVFVLEVNTIPGFTATSLLPKAAAALGWSFPELCDRVMKTAWPSSPGTIL